MLSLPFGTQINNIIIITINTLQRAVHFVYLIIVALCLFLATPCSQFLFSIFPNDFFSLNIITATACASQTDSAVTDCCHLSIGIQIRDWKILLTSNKCIWILLEFFIAKKILRFKKINSLKGSLNVRQLLVLWSIIQVFKGKLPDFKMVILTRNDEQQVLVGSGFKLHSDKPCRTNSLLLQQKSLNVRLKYTILVLQ